MKKIFTLFFLSLLTLAGFGQSLKILYNGREYRNGDSIYLSASDRRFDMDIVNGSNDSIWMQVKKTEISILEGTSNNFCIGECYTGNTSDILPIAGGDTLSRNNGSEYYFYIQYDSEGKSGTSVIRYNFINTRDVSDSVSLLAFISSTNNIEQPKPAVSFLNAYPNPATSKVTIQYNLNGQHYTDMKMVIKNIMGATITTLPLSQNADKISVDVSSIPNGLYLYSIESKGKVLLTKKLVIK